MRLRTHLFFAFVILAAPICPVQAQETERETEKTIEAPSPDGRFAFLHTITPEMKTFDLIEKKSGKVLLRVVDSDDGIGNRLSATVLWAPDSKRFAITYMIGSLEVDVEYMIDGESGSITPTRTAVLGFDRAGKVTIRKSTTKFKTENASGD
jgi:hypothetical protein